MTSVLDSMWHGQPAQVIQSDSLRAVVLPERGGRIASLIDAHGREWLEQPALPLVAAESLPDEFVDGDMFGWDECAPTIDACVVDEWAMPDHGDIWDIAWTDGGDGWLEAASPAGTHSLRRRIVPHGGGLDGGGLDGGGLRIDYEASTTLDRFPYLWSAHPQFLAPPGTRVALDRVVTAMIDVEDPQLSRHEMTQHLTSIDSFAPGGAGKFFVEPHVYVDSATLVRSDGAALRMAWDASTLPYLGLWFDRGRHARHDVISIEPMTGFFDSTAVAAARGKVTMLSSATPLRWSLDLSVTL